MDVCWNRAHADGRWRMQDDAKGGSHGGSEHIATAAAAAAHETQTTRKMQQHQLQQQHKNQWHSLENICRVFSASLFFAYASVRIVKHTHVPYLNERTAHTLSVNNIIQFCSLIRLLNISAAFSGRAHCSRGTTSLVSSHMPFASSASSLHSLNLNRSAFEQRTYFFIMCILL